MLVFPEWGAICFPKKQSLLYGGIHLVCCKDFRKDGFQNVHQGTQRRNAPCVAVRMSPIGRQNCRQYNTLAPSAAAGIADSTKLGPQTGTVVTPGSVVVVGTHFFIK